jgi:hypothetical protein
MSTPSGLATVALLSALSLIASPSVACERHQNHQASVVQAEPVTPPPVRPASEPTLISPSAAAMSASEALGMEPAAMRCRMRKQEQALTQ